MLDIQKQWVLELNIVFVIWRNPEEVMHWLRSASAVNAAKEHQTALLSALHRFYTVRFIVGPITPALLSAWPRSLLTWHPGGLGRAARAHRRNAPSLRLLPPPAADDFAGGDAGRSEPLPTAPNLNPH